MLLGCSQDVTMLNLTLYWEWLPNSKHVWDHKLFIVIVFYKNTLCFECASTSCRVANLKLSKTPVFRLVCGHIYSHHFFLWLVVIQFCNIIVNLRAIFVIILRYVAIWLRWKTNLQVVRNICIKFCMHKWNEMLISSFKAWSSLVTRAK